jgi:mannosyltransferase OCH1-like enzyme
MIPKIIHYCWFGPKPLPHLVIKCLESWKDHLPEYELNFWNESNSPMDLPFVQEAYSAKKYAFVSDYVRFWALFQYGGIYLDTDMFVVRSFDDLLDNSVFFGYETDMKMSISCGVIGAIPKAPFIAGIVRYYEGLHFTMDSIPELVIPRIVSKYYNKSVHNEDITIYPYDYFYPFPYEEKESNSKFIRYKTSNTYAIHLWNVSWGSFKDKLRDKIIYHTKKLVRKAKQ